jgi:hypothetical protein
MGQTYLLDPSNVSLTYYQAQGNVGKYLCLTQVCLGLVCLPSPNKMWVMHVCHTYVNLSKTCLILLFLFLLIYLLINLKKYYYYWKKTIILIWRVRLKIIIIIIIINKFLKIYYYYWKKNHKFDLNGKIKNYKNFEKKIKEKNKESRVEGLNWKYRESDMIVKLNFTWVLGSDKVARPKLLDLSIERLNWKYRESIWLSN